MINNNLRIGGLATGLDIDSMVKELMKAQRMQGDKLYQNKQIWQWKQEDYRDLNMSLMALRDSAFNMRLSSSYSAKKVTSSNENVVSVTASNSAAGSYSIKVNKLAASASIRTGDADNIVRTAAVVTTGQISYPLVITDANNSVDINGVTITLTPGTYYSNGLVAELQKQVDNSSLGANAIRVSLDKDNKIMLTGVGTTTSITLTNFEGDLQTKLGFTAGTVNHQDIAKIDLGENLYAMMDRFANYDKSTFGWIADVRERIAGDGTANYISNINFADLKTNQNPKNIIVTVNGTTYNVVTDPAKTLGDNDVLITDDGSGKAKLTFKNNIAAGTEITIDRHDFQFTLSAYNQSGTQVTKTFVIDAYSDTMNTLINKINSDSELGLSAFYDEAKNKMVITADKTGNNNSAGDDIAVQENFLTTVLKINTYTDGQDAEIVLNGLTTTRKDNTFTVNGVTFTLKQEQLAGDSPVTVSVSNDIDKVVENIKAFIDKYNETLGKFNDKLKEERFKDYPPLTDSMKENLTDKEIEKWEEKARSGLLENDPILNGITSSLRQVMYASVSGLSSDMDNLTEIGIGTKSYGDFGKLTVDEAKLREALAKDFDGVVKLFTNNPTGGQDNEKGIAYRLYEKVNAGIKNIAQTAGYSSSLYDQSFISKTIRDIDKRIDSFEDRMARLEDRYWRQFTAMEKAINQLNAQSAWLAQQFGGQNNG